MLAVCETQLISVFRRFFFSFVVLVVVIVKVIAQGKLYEIPSYDPPPPPPPRREKLRRRKHARSHARTANMNEAIFQDELS